MKKLADWMFENGWTPGRMQRELGLKSRSTIGRYNTGRQYPAPDVMRKIYRLTRGEVTFEAFLDHSPPKCAAVITLPNGRRRVVFPWSGRDEDIDAALAVVRAEQPDMNTVSPQVTAAIDVLGHRAREIKDGLYFLDGRVVDARRLIAGANRILLQRGEPPIAYPEVKGANVVPAR